MSDAEFITYAVVLGLCAASLFLVAVPRSLAMMRDPNRPPPVPTGRVLTTGFTVYDILFVIAILCLMASNLVAKGDVPEVSLFALVATFVIQMGGVVFIVGILVWRMDLVAQWGLRWRQWWKAFLGIFVVVFMIAFMNVLALSGYHEFIEGLIGGETQQPMVTLLQEEKNLPVIVFVGLVAVIGAPLSEEVLFRGYIYPAIKRVLGIWGAVVLSAAIFSLMHFNLAALLPLFVLGVILALSYERTGSLWMPIAIHFFFNANTVVVSQIAARYPELFEEAKEAAMLWPG